jgi:hypothetical protein
MDDSRHVPPVPPQPRPGAVERGDAWREIWELAHREMAPWGRLPAPYLIDRLTDPRLGDRRWLIEHLSLIAQITREREYDDEQTGGALAWNTTITDPAGARRSIRILMNRSRGWIFNAYPED